MGQAVDAGDPDRARPERDLPAPYSYVVPPTRISPDVGAVSGDSPPFFREPHLLVNDLGIATVFMETPAGNPVGRLGWSCSSSDGRDWDCGTISKIGTAEDFHDFADPWVADTRGDPCPTYGAGITLAALENAEQFTAQGTLEQNNRAKTVAYHSTDMGRTWTGPEPIPEPAFDAGPDGSKVIFTGRTFVAYRTFVETGQYVSRLGAGSDPCAFSEPLQLTEANDHPRLAATDEPDGFAMRGVAPSTTAGGSTITFNSFGPELDTRLRDVPMATTLGPSTIQAFCTSDPTCFTIADVAQTLLYDPVRDRYHHVFTDQPLPGQGEPLGDLVTRYNFSDDGGLTWSVPVLVAGSGAEFSEVGAASLEPTLAWDPVTEQMLFAYYEKPTKDSLRAELRVRVMGDDGRFASPVTVDETSYVGLGGEARFGDYFGFQACGGVLHLAHHPISNDGIGSIAYLAVRYADQSDSPARRQCPRLVGAPEDSSESPGGPDDMPGDPDEVPEDPDDQPDDPDDASEDADDVQRVGGSSRLETAVSVSQAAFERADVALLARVDDFPDALAASGLAAELDAPVLLTPTGGLDELVAEEVQRLGVTEVYLLGGTAALSEQVEADLDELDIAHRRVGGAERFETAALIAREVVGLGGPVDQAIVALGSRPDGRDAWPDALAAGNLAAAGRAPILLTAPDRLPEVTSAALEGVLGDGDRLFIAGGTQAVGAAVEQKLSDSGYVTDRLAGPDRYATAVAVVEEARRQGTDAEPTLLASGEIFADALVAAPAARRLGGVMVLVDGDDLDDSPATRDFLIANTEHIDTAIITGDLDTITDHVADQIRTALRTS